MKHNTYNYEGGQPFKVEAPFTPVSYTHLDVYKRQSDELKKMYVRATNPEDIVLIQSPVDVYKRQVLIHPPMITM